MRLYTVEVLLKDSPTPYIYKHILSVHEEFSYTVLYVSKKLIYRFTTNLVCRLKLIEE